MQQHMSNRELLDKDKMWFLLLDEEKQRVASMRRLQVESEQFLHFEEQLRRQELANQRRAEVGPNVTFPADFSLIRAAISLDTCQ